MIPGFDLSQLIDPVQLAQLNYPTGVPRPGVPSSSIRPPGDPYMSGSIGSPAVPPPPAPPIPPGPMIRPGSFLDSVRNKLTQPAQPSQPRVELEGTPPVPGFQPPQNTMPGQAIPGMSAFSPQSLFSPEAIAQAAIARGVPPPSSPTNGVPQTGPVSARSSTTESLGGLVDPAEKQTQRSALSGVKAPTAPSPQRISSPPPYRPTNRIDTPNPDFQRLLSMALGIGQGLNLPNTLGEAVNGVGRRR